MTISDFENNNETSNDSTTPGLQPSEHDSCEQSQVGTTTATNNDDEVIEEDDDDLTVIVLDHVVDEGQESTMDWIEQTGPEMEERRRSILLGELRRVQRASFTHFSLLCLIPTVLLVIVIATILGEKEDCGSEASFCELEPRTFVNAYTTRCICDPIPVDRSVDN